MPGSGPVILAPNHFSFMDHFFVGMFTRAQGPLHGQVAALQAADAVHLHATAACSRCAAAHRDEEAFITAETVLGRGGRVAMYCEGGRSRTGKLSEKAKPGIGRLALETGAPIVPVAIYGSSKVRNWKRLQFPKVTVQYGEPIRFERRRAPDARAAAGGRRRDLRRIKELYAGLEEHGRKGARAKARVAGTTAA